jgi:hypothetical protein
MGRYQHPASGLGDEAWPRFRKMTMRFERPSYTREAGTKNRLAQKNRTWRGSSVMLRAFPCLCKIIALYTLYIYPKLLALAGRLPTHQFCLRLSLHIPFSSAIYDYHRPQVSHASFVL